MENNFIIIASWVIAALSIVGVHYNIHKKRICFLFWMVTNASWIVIDIVYGVYAQAALMLVYFVLAIRGYIKWKEDDND